MKSAACLALFIAFLSSGASAAADSSHERSRQKIETTSSDSRLLSENYAAIAREEAEKGHREAMLIYARHLEASGSTTEAASWYDRHAEEASRAEQLKLSEWYLSQDKPELEPKAERWLKAASKGTDEIARTAYETLGELYVTSKKIGNLERARTAYRNAAELGSVYSAFQLGELYQRKDAPFKNAKLALSWYKRAAESGNVLAQMKLGDIYGTSDSQARNMDEAFHWWTLAARGGNPTAIERLRTFDLPVPTDIKPEYSPAPAPSTERPSNPIETRHIRILKPPREFPVWFATNRRPVDTKNYKKGFTAKPDTTVHYGLSKVLVPEGHEFGTVSSAWYKKFTVGPDGSLKLISQEKLSGTEFGSAVAKWAATWQANEPEMLIIIHGFNVDFNEAMLRAAQIGYDLKVRGPVLAFSWPSKGDLGPRDYTTDENAVNISQPAIHDFLVRASQIAAHANIKKVHLIAHSMGNRGLMESILYGNSASPNSHLRFDQVFLAAPDMDKVRFTQLAKLYTESTRVKAKRTTLYVSPRDLALGASEWVHRNNSIGRTPPVPVLPGIQTIEVSNIDLGLLGHSYIFEAERVLSDMKELMDGNKEPGRRLFPRQAKTDDGKRYWKITK